jgi:lipopolysaccharide transport system permease protein
MPMAALVAGLLDFAISFAVLLLMLGWYGMLSLSHLFWLPFFMLLAIVTALGVGLWLSALNVEYRDVRYVLPFVVQFWMFATPIPYPSSLLRQPWRTLYGINPMAGVVEGFRWSLYGSGAAPGAMIMVSALVSLAVLAGGILYFRSVEKSFADVI